jgi:hypothetical protein
LIDRAVVLRNTGVSPNERYSEDDPAWTVPKDSLPVGLDAEVPLTLDDLIENAGSADEPEVWDT